MRRLVAIALFCLSILPSTPAQEIPAGESGLGADAALRPAGVPAGPTIVEIQGLVGYLLGETEGPPPPALDLDGSGRVDLCDLQRAVGDALEGDRDALRRRMESAASRAEAEAVLAEMAAMRVPAPDPLRLTMNSAANDLPRDPLAGTMSDPVLERSLIETHGLKVVEAAYELWGEKQLRPELERLSKKLRRYADRIDALGDLSRSTLAVLEGGPTDDPAESLRTFKEFWSALTAIVPAIPGFGQMAGTYGEVIAWAADEVDFLADRCRRIDRGRLEVTYPGAWPGGDVLHSYMLEVHEARRRHRPELPAPDDDVVEWVADNRKILRIVTGEDPLALGEDDREWISLWFAEHHEAIALYVYDGATLVYDD